jgi:hypothetical protein
MPAVVPAAHVEIINAHKNHRRLRAPASDSDENFERKEHVTEVERV